MSHFFVELLDDLRLVIGHADDTYADGFELVSDVIQFHELTNAEWSPVDRSVENKQQPVGPLQRMKCLLLAVLIRGRQHRRHGAHAGSPGSGVLGFRERKLSHASKRSRDQPMPQPRQPVASVRSLSHTGLLEVQL
jgi:hypothetical protein